MKKIYILTTSLLFCTFLTNAQIKEPLKWTFNAQKVNDSIANVYFTVKIDKGWHVFSQKNINTDSLLPTTTFEFEKSKDYQLIGKVTEPKGIEKFETVFNAKVIYFENSVTFTQQIKFISRNTITVKGNVFSIICNDKGCMPADKDFSIQIDK